MAFDETPSEFLNVNDFALTASFGGSDLVGILDVEYFDAVGGSAGVAGYMKTFLVATEDIATMSTGDQVTIAGTIYEVVNMQRDLNEAFTKLILMET